MSTSQSVSDLASKALLEDIPLDDITSAAIADLMPPTVQAKFRAKQDLVLSGLEVCKELASRFSSLHLDFYFLDGQRVLDGQVIGGVSGSPRELLKFERVALNFLGHLSGVATLTRKFVDACASSKTQILDTRKTIPGLRALQKKAVVHGGGLNHRKSLSDQILIKDNHIRLAGGIGPALSAVRSRTQQFLIVEVKTVEELLEALEHDPQVVLLDNMSDAEIAACVPLVKEPIQIEVSGNITLDRVRKLSEIGVHRISIGALTHSAPNADINLKII